MSEQIYTFTRDSEMGWLPPILTRSIRVLIIQARNARNAGYEFRITAFKEYRTVRYALDNDEEAVVESIEAAFGPEDTGKQRNPKNSGREKPSVRRQSQP